METIAVLWLSLHYRLIRVKHVNAHKAYAARYQLLTDLLCQVRVIEILFLPPLFGPPCAYQHDYARFYIFLVWLEGTPADLCLWLDIVRDIDDDSTTDQLGQRDLVYR